MSRAKRLLELLENLRRRKYPVTGAALATELGISTRSLYRDISTLQSQGARIDGATGLGYILRPGFTLPPLMLQPEEVEALALGARWVADRTDERLAQAAESALAKITAVLPPGQRDVLDGSTLMVGPGALKREVGGQIPALRRAIRAELRVSMDYHDATDQASSRTVWPFALAYFDSARVVVAWCELRKGYRNFRTDRIRGLEVLDERYPRRRRSLLEEWRQTLISKAPIEAAPNFAMFVLASGDTLGLWARHDVQPAPNPGGGSELIFTAKDKPEVDALHREWKGRGWAIAQDPVQKDFGYTFTALDPDGHRLRVFHPARP